MTKRFGVDNFSEDSPEDQGEEEDEGKVCNRIFLNFTREFRHPSKDHYNYLKVKELFRYLSERKDLQEMKVSGRLDNKEMDEDDKNEDEDGEKADGEEDDEENSKEDGEWESSYDEETTPKRGGQRFAMSRDFWYRKLNTLKAQKLDEAALEARDIPPHFQSKEQRFANWINKRKPLSKEKIIAEKPEDVIAEIDRFEEAVAKPVEKELKTRFINVYENRKHFRCDRCE